MLHCATQCYTVLHNATLCYTMLHCALSTIFVIYGMAQLLLHIFCSAVIYYDNDGKLNSRHPRNVPFIPVKCKCKLKPLITEYEGDLVN